MREDKHVILCIDDDSDFLDVIALILEGNDYIMERALSAQEGLLKYKQEAPDLVIVDLMMEEVDSGTSFVRDLKALGPTPPIYMLSSIGDNLNLSADYAALGLTGVLQKPVNPDVLLSTLKTKLK